MCMQRVEPNLIPAAYWRLVRLAVGMSQVEMAQRLGVSEMSVVHWERGKRCNNGAAERLLLSWIRTDEWRAKLASAKVPLPPVLLPPEVKAAS